MPGRRDHLRADRVLLGKAHPAVHAMMDGPAKYLYGAHHMAFHDSATVVNVRRQLGEEAGLAAALHIALDMGVVTMVDVRVWAIVCRAFRQ